jgi:hypothetical protein
LEGHLVGSEGNNVKGQASYRWLPGGFFLEQQIELYFMGLQIQSLELIGYDPQTGTFPSTVFSNMSPTPLPYRWEVEGDSVKGSPSTIRRSMPRSPADSGRAAMSSRAAGVRTLGRTRARTWPTTSPGAGSRGRKRSGPSTEGPLLRSGETYRAAAFLY